MAAGKQSFWSEDMMPEKRQLGDVCRFPHDARTGLSCAPSSQATEAVSIFNRRQIINISHSSDGGSGAVVVWYVRNFL